MNDSVAVDAKRILLRYGAPITVLDQELRVCRGNAGTLFALLRRDDLAVEQFL